MIVNVYSQKYAPGWISERLKAAQSDGVAGPKNATEDPALSIRQSYHDMHFESSIDSASQSQS